MYCIYCGMKTEESYNVCPNCGAIIKDMNGMNITNNAVVNNMNMQNTAYIKNKSNWKDTLSIISALIGVYFCYVVYSSYKEILTEDIVKYRESPAAAAFGCVLIQLVFAVIAFVLAHSARKVNPNNKNKISIILSITVCIISIVQFIMIYSWLCY